MRPADPLFDAFKGVEPHIDVSIGIQHGQLSNRGNDTDSDDRNGLDSSDVETVPEGEPVNPFQSLCLERSDSETSSSEVDFDAILGRL